MKLINEQIMNVVDDVDTEISKLISEELSVSVTNNVRDNLKVKVSAQVHRMRNEIKKIVDNE